MLVIKIIFWFLLFVVFYTYLGYGLLLYILISLKNLFRKNLKPTCSEIEPEVTLFITAYNEKDFVVPKMENCLALDYPKEKLKIVWVTDGSDDGTPELLQQYEADGVKVYHQAERKGKINAMQRGVKFVNTPILIFSDANTLLSKDSIRRIVRQFSNPKVGCVSGEKRILMEHQQSAEATEGIYWKYESKLKQWDAQVYSVVGAAGELFAIRTELFQEIEPDTLLDDFIISLRIAMQGYIIGYDPAAYALETPSANVKEELKRKVRISAGGIQSIFRLKPLLNPFKYGWLSFQYISHRVLRWSLAPASLPLIFILNLIIAFHSPFSFSNIYTWLFMAQIAFYLLAFLGWIFESYQIKWKIFYIPYYFFMMNYAAYLGFIRYLKKQQSVNWEKTKRASNIKITSSIHT